MCHTHVYYISSLICLLSAEMFVERDKFLKYFKTVEEIKTEITGIFHHPHAKSYEEESQPIRNCIASSVRLNLCGYSKLMLCALAATESRSSSCVQNFLHLLHQPPSTSTNANVAVLWARAEKWDCSQTRNLRKRFVFSWMGSWCVVNWTRINPGTRRYRRMPTRGRDKCGAEHPPLQKMVVQLQPKTQHACWSTLLCCYVFDILPFWQWCPVKWGIAKQSETRLTKGLPLQHWSVLGERGAN